MVTKASSSKKCMQLPLIGVCVEHSFVFTASLMMSFVSAMAGFISFEVAARQVSRAAALPCRAQYHPMP